jgi:hypothetical protein
MDLYTKIILTVIAGALSVIAWQGVAPVPARAQAQAPTLNRVVICDSDHPARCASISDKGQLDVSAHPGS